jgi:hypothetical protein
MAQINSKNKGAWCTQSDFKIGFSHLTSAEEYLQVGDGDFDITPQSKHSALSNDSSIHRKYA